MASVSVGDVKPLLVNAGDLSLESFITTAEVYVAENLTGKGLSESILREIKIYLAAHFATLVIEGNSLTRKEMGQSSESYKGVSTKERGLSFTRFGQQAIAFDTTGTLAALAKNNLTARFTVV